MACDISQPVLSPCIGICQFGDDGLGVGCFRTASEIGAWMSMGSNERARLMNEVLPLREAGHP